MATGNTYSFADINFVISHPAVGQVPVNGQAIGTITKSMSTDRTAHLVAADGTVVPSLVLGKNGTFSLSIIQTSALHKWLVKWANYLDSPGNVGQFASTTLTIHAPMMGENISASGVTHQKFADRSFQAQAQMVTWTLMATNIEEQ